MIVIVFGFPGSGKTYFATAFSKALRFAHYNTDQIRKETIYNTDYSDKEKESVYDAMIQKIVPGVNIIFDGTFYKQSLREKFVDKAKGENQSLFFIEIQTSEETILKRVSVKRTDSDADFGVYLKIKKEFETMHKDHLILNSESLTLEKMIEKAKEYLKLI